MKASVPILIATILSLAPEFSVYGQRAGVNDAAIVDEMHDRYYSETSAEAFAGKYGSKAVPVLAELQSRESETLRVKAKICFYLGKIGDQSAVARMIDFFESPLSGEISADELAAWDLASAGLGFTGDERALEYLKTRASAVYWADRARHEDFTFESRSFREGIYYFRLYALGGIAISGTPRGEEILEDLSNQEDFGIPRHIILGALEECRTRKREEHILRRENSKTIP